VVEVLARVPDLISHEWEEERLGHIPDPVSPKWEEEVMGRVPDPVSPEWEVENEEHEDVLSNVDHETELRLVIDGT